MFKIYISIVYMYIYRYIKLVDGWKKTLYYNLEKLFLDVGDIKKYKRSGENIQRSVL